jgi:hypothetical protein
MFIKFVTLLELSLVEKNSSTENKKVRFFVFFIKIEKFLTKADLVMVDMKVYT